MKRLSYSNTTATLALFVALGGTSYAVSQLPTNSVGGAQIREGAVSSNEVRDRSLRARDFARPSSLRGPAGPPGTAQAYARVAADGTASFVHGQVESRRISTGRYCVIAFTRTTSAGASSPVSTGTPANIVVTPESAAPRFATVDAQREGSGGDCQGGTGVSVFDGLSGAPADGAFYFAAN